MKLKDLQAMSEQEQQIMLAKLDGWKIDPELEDGALMGWHFKGPWTMVYDYHHDLNAIAAAEIRAGLHNEENLALRVKWAENLHAILAQRCPRNKAGTPLISDIHKMLASASERTQALILTLAP